MKPPRSLLPAFLLLGPAFAPALAGAVPPPAPGTLRALAQDPGDLDRLAREQQRLAEQARRLERLLGVLENKEREAGETVRADLLAQARERLAAAGEQGDLVAVLEAVAADLAALRAGSALEAQQEVIALLQELLDALLAWRMQSQLQALQEAARQRQEALERLAEAQSRLLEETRKAADGEAAAAPGELARRQEELNRELREQAGAQDADPLQEDLERAAGHGERAAELLEAGEPQDREDGPEDGGRPETGGQAPQETPQEQKQRLDEAAREQAQALDALRRAAAAARQEAERLQEGQRAEELLDVARKAEELLERHRAVAAPLAELVAGLGPGRPPRSARVRLRQWAGEEEALAQEAADLALAIRERGGDIFPFMLNALRDDHRLLAGRLGPPSSRAGEREAELAGRITGGWVELIEALRTEAERIRQRIRQPQGQQGEEQPRPLVEFAAELQLLKRLEADLRDRLSGLQRRRAALDAAGIAPDEDDVREVEALAERQQELRRLYEAMLERLREAEKKETEKA